MTRGALPAACLLGLALLGSCSTEGDQGRPPAAVIQDENDGYAGTLVEDPPLVPAGVVLEDTAGEPWDLARLGDESVTALFFGFTRCDDVCPTTMADLAAARRSLPPELASRVQVVFVTVDPCRDSPAVMRRWLDRFDEDFVGLRGPLRSVHRLEDSLYAAPSSKERAAEDHAHSGGDVPPTAADTYEVSHTGSVYLFAPGGVSVVHTGGTSVADYAADLTRLLPRG